MLHAKNAQTAPFFFADGTPQPDLTTGKQLCLSYSLAAEASFAFVKEAGILPREPDAAKLKELIYNMPSQRLFKAVGALPLERRIAITSAIVSDLEQRLGAPLTLAPGALPFVWRSSSIFLLERDAATGENRVRLNIRSHRTNLTIARNIASGSGYTGIRNGHIETAEETALKELREESGIEIAPSQIVPLGYAMRNIPMKMPMLTTKDNVGVVPGLMTEFTYYGYYPMPENGAADITLSSESFGSISYSYKDLLALASGQSVDGIFHASEAPFVQEFVGAVRAQAEKAGEPFTFAKLAAHAEETGVLAKDHHGQKGKLALHDPIAVTISPEDFMMGKVNWIADAMKALHHAGQPASATARSYVERHSCIDLPAEACVRHLAGILPPGNSPTHPAIRW